MHRAYQCCELGRLYNVYMPIMEQHLQRDTLSTAWGLRLHTEHVEHAEHPLRVRARLGVHLAWRECRKLLVRERHLATVLARKCDGRPAWRKRLRQLYAVR